MKQEAIGLTGIDYLTKTGINYYQSLAPNQNVVYGLDNVVNNVDKLLGQLSVPRVLWYQCKRGKWNNFKLGAMAISSYVI